MCTVTFCNTGLGLVFTSNRDEQSNRPLASEIRIKEYNGVTLWFPEDPKSQGSWFCINHKGEVLIVLNGAFEKHIPNPPYRTSRGCILLEIASSRHITETWKKIDLGQIEPFTVIAYTNQQIQEYIWDGETKHHKHHPNTCWNIWSSVTLYSPFIRARREMWFSDFIASNRKVLTPEDLLYFHTTTETHDSKNGLIINRDNQTLTKNITQCYIKDSSFVLSHYDLLNHHQTHLKETLR